MIYTFYWLDGTQSHAKGGTPEQAMNNAGYGAGSIRALDFYSEGVNNDYEGDESEHRWTWTESKKKELGLVKG